MSYSASATGKRNLRESTCVGSHFLNLKDKVLDHFNDIAHYIAHSGGSVVFKEGGPADGIYVVCAGDVKLYASSTDGHRLTLKLAKCGDVLGLSAALNNLPYEVTAQTLGPCRFKHVGRHAFLSFLRAHAEAAYAAALTLAREHREVTLGTRRLVLLPTASARLSQILIEFAELEATRKQPSSFPILLTHAELGSLTGASRETITRLLNRFERDGIIVRDDSMITILKPTELKQLAR
jgi:CRP/FNR family transcriptional regulator, cyclic AMP receptor protein